MTPKAWIKLVIADDHVIYRRGIKATLCAMQHHRFAVVGEAENGREALEAVAKHDPHLVLMNVQLPFMNGVEATVSIKERHPLVRVIALSPAATCEHVLAMVTAGADGYLLKNTSLAELVQAIEIVHKGSVYFTPSAGAHLTTRLRQEKEQKKVSLTKRETEILTLICDGNSSKEIATTLYVSKRTVDSFREKIIQKTGVKNTFQLLRYAIREKLVKM